MALILVVDDEFAVAEVLQVMIEDEGHQVLMASNGRAGLAAMAANQPDIVFTDTMMPVMGGPEMVRAMADDPRLRRLKVVAMSSFPETTVGPDYVSYTAFLSKPFRLNDVIGILSRVLRTG